MTFMRYHLRVGSGRNMLILILAIALLRAAPQAGAQELVPIPLQSILQVQLTTEFASVARYNSHLRTADSARKEKVKHRTMSRIFGAASLGSAVLAVTQYRIKERQPKPHRRTRALP